MLNKKWDKRYLLLVVAIICLILYFYGSQLKKDNEFLDYLPAIGGGAYALNFIVRLAQI